MKRVANKDKQIFSNCQESHIEIIDIEEILRHAGSRCVGTLPMLPVSSSRSISVPRVTTMPPRDSELSAVPLHAANKNFWQSMLY
ncbi:hypothetical protein L0337_34965 [candidate division KSB1 bacterium]|nr:hypothetical protein [candidate division KSB1 bacterium]